MTTPKYALNRQELDRYAGMVLLERMVNRGDSYGVMLEGDSALLDPVLKALVFDGSLDLKGTRYVVTQKGRDVIKALLQRYREYSSAFDLYRAVDLAKGEFAYASYFNDEFSLANDPERKLWDAFLAQERWEDLRVAVAEFKKANPIDIVFMAFVKDGRFDTTSRGWEFDLVLGATFKEMLAVCNSNLHVEQLGYTPDGGQAVTGEAVIRDVVAQGAELMFQLIRQEQEEQRRYEEQLAAYNASQAQEAAAGSGGTATETVTVIETVEYVIEDPLDYYGPYYRDPYYLSPVWTVPLWVMLL